MQLAAAHTDMLQGPCGLELPLVAWRLDSRAQRGERTAVADRGVHGRGSGPCVESLSIASASRSALLAEVSDEGVSSPSIAIGSVSHPCCSNSRKAACAPTLAC